MVHRLDRDHKAVQDMLVLQLDHLGFMVLLVANNLRLDVPVVTKAQI